MTPRMIEIATDAISNIGKYIIVYHEKMKRYQIDIVKRVHADLNKQSGTYYLITEQYHHQLFNAHSRVFESRKEAEEALTSLIKKQEKEEQNA